MEYFGQAPLPPSPGTQLLSLLGLFPGNFPGPESPLEGGQRTGKAPEAQLPTPSKNLNTKAGWPPSTLSRRGLDFPEGTEKANEERAGQEGPCRGQPLAGRILQEWGQNKRGSKRVRWKPSIPWDKAFRNRERGFSRDLREQTNSLVSRENSFCPPGAEG